MHILRMVATAALIGLLVSCGSLAPPGYRDVPSINTMAIRKAPVHRDASTDRSFLFAILAFKPTVDKSQPTLFALRGRDHQIVVPPEYTELCCWRSDAALGKHHLSKQWQRIDLDTGERTPLPFAELVRVRSGRRPTDGPTHWVGATRQSDQLWTIVLLGEDGQPAMTLSDVADRSFVDGPQPLDYLPAGGYVVHFEPVGQEAYDRIYNVDGCVISPPLPPLLRMLGDAEQAPVIGHAIVLDKARGLCWPVLDDGSIMPKPDDALGLLPLPNADAPQGWAAGWQTADGERWAILPRFRIAGEELLTSREQASFSDVVCQARRQRGGEGYTVTRWTWLARDGANGSTMAYDANGDQLEPILALSTSSMAAAAEQVRKLSTAATTTARAESAEMARLAREAEARRVAALEAARRAKRERTRLAKIEVERLVAAGKFAAADAYMWQNCAYTETIVWLASAASGQIEQLSLGTLNIAARSGKNQQLFRSAYRDRVAQLNARSSPGQLGHGGFSGSAASTWQPSKSAPYADVNSQMKTIFDNMRQNSMNNYLSGKQSWYFSSNSSTRR